MKNLFVKKYVAFMLAVVPLWGNAQEVVELKDPTGKVQVNVTIDDELTYSVLHENDVMVGTSPISMTLTDGTVFGKEPRLRRKRYRTENQTIYPPLYKKKSIKDHYNELVLDFRGGFSVIFRAYEDGAAYRFVSHLKKKLSGCKRAGDI